MYYPKLTYASSTIEGIFLFGILCLSNKIYGLESLYYIGKNQKVLNWNPTIGQWATGLHCELRWDFCHEPTAGAHAASFLWSIFREMRFSFDFLQALNRVILSLKKKVDLIVYFKSVDRIATGNQFCFKKREIHIWIRIHMQQL